MFIGSTPQLHQYAYYSVGLLSSFDKFYEHQKLVVGPKKKAQREQRKLEKRLLKGACSEFIFGLILSGKVAILVVIFSSNEANKEYRPAKSE